MAKECPKYSVEGVAELCPVLTVKGGTVIHNGAEFSGLENPQPGIAAHKENAEVIAKLLFDAEIKMAQPSLWKPGTV